jgi:NAD(P)-dependent dehydrogenase (short-subunit alcohol dehydrogenase family)
MGGHIAFPGFSLYHAAKWGIEGFFEALAAEIEPFGIRTTLVEPGMVRSGFFDAADHVDVSAPYRGNPAVDHDPIPLEAMPGDPVRVADAIRCTGLASDPPRRLLLGSDAYQLVRPALASRLAEVDAQRDTAADTDFPTDVDSPDAPGSATEAVAARM